MINYLIAALLMCDSENYRILFGREARQDCVKKIMDCVTTTGKGPAESIDKVEKKCFMESMK